MGGLIKAPKPQTPPPPPPPPEVPEGDMEDPLAFEAARKRISEQQGRVNRNRLKIPLNTPQGGRSGLQV